LLAVEGGTSSDALRNLRSRLVHAVVDAEDDVEVDLTSVDPADPAVWQLLILVNSWLDSSGRKLRLLAPS
jgi:hypothetical protein